MPYVVLEIMVTIISALVAQHQRAWMPLTVARHRFDLQAQGGVRVLDADAALQAGADLEHVHRGVALQRLELGDKRNGKQVKEGGGRLAPIRFAGASGHIRVPLLLDQLGA